MIQKDKYIITAIAAVTGFITGLLGGGGGMILVPMLTLFTVMDEDAVFPSSISIMLPICLVCIIAGANHSPPNLKAALPYLAGSAVGGFWAGKVGSGIPVQWLHRILGILLLWGGFRHLC